MIIPLSPRLEAALIEEAKKRGTDPESLVVHALSERFIPAEVKLEPQDEWERSLFAIATDCGVSLSNEALSSEGLYE